MTRRITLAFKKRICGHCNRANKGAMKQGKAHCSFDGKPRIRVGQCLEVVK